MAIVARYRDLAAAEVASASLEAAGIENILVDTQTIGVAWYYSTALGGIRLHVKESDVAEAKALLDEAADVEWPEVPAGSADEQCWVCGSFALELDSGPRKTLAVMTASFFPLWVWRSRLRCRKCGASRKVRFQVRPELLIASFALAIVVTAAIVILTLVMGYAIYGRRA